MTGKNVGSQLGKMPRDTSKAYKPVKYLYDRLGQLIPEQQLLKSLGLNRTPASRASNYSYYNGFILKYKSKETTVYFLPRKEDMENEKKKFEETYEYDQDKLKKEQEKLIKNYVDKIQDTSGHESVSYRGEVTFSTETTASGYVSETKKEYEITNDGYETQENMETQKFDLDLEIQKLKKEITRQELNLLVLNSQKSQNSNAKKREIKKEIELTQFDIQKNKEMLNNWKQLGVPV